MVEIKSKVTHKHCSPLIVDYHPNTTVILCQNALIKYKSQIQKTNNYVKCKPNQTQWSTCLRRIVQSVQMFLIHYGSVKEGDDFYYPVLFIKALRHSIKMFNVATY